MKKIDRNVEWDIAFEKALLTRPSYREFLRVFFDKDVKWVSPRPLSYSGFAARARFSSKAFLRDVIEGDKRLTPNSFWQVVDGLKLDDLWSEYLRCLVSFEEEGFHSRVETRDRVTRRLTGLKKQIRLRQKIRNLKGDGELVRVFLSEGFPEVYASLGEGDKPVQLPDVVRRSGFEEARVKAILARMQEVNLIEILENGEGYLPRQGALQADALYSSEVFALDFARAVEKVKARFAKQSNSDSSLFMVQTFAINSRSLPKLRVELAKVIETFATEAEDAEGDGVADICIGFTNNLSPA